MTHEVEKTGLDTYFRSVRSIEVKITMAPTVLGVVYASHTYRREISLRKFILRCLLESQNKKIKGKDDKVALPHPLSFLDSGSRYFVQGVPEAQYLHGVPFLSDGMDAYEEFFGLRE